MKKLVLCWLACATVPVLSAQETAPPKLPPGPLLNKAPEFAQWTIMSKAAAPAEAESSGEQSESSPSPSPTMRHKQKSPESGGKKPAASVEQKTVVTKTQALRHEETSGGTSPRIDKWCLADMQVTMGGSAAPVVMLSNNSSDSDDVNYAKTDFPGFEWLAEEKFTGTKKVMNQECLIFEDKALPKKKGAVSEGPSVMIASINAATRLPVALQAGDETQTFEFGLAPTAMLTLPPEVESLVEQWRKTMSQSALMPAKP